jgi:hypothetical protein
MELYRLGTRQRPLYAWQPVCKWVKTVQKTVPLWYLSGNNQCPDFKKGCPLTSYPKWFKTEHIYENRSDAIRSGKYPYFS